MLLLLTRPETASRRFLAQVEAVAGQPVPHVIAPLMRIVPLDQRPELEGHASAIFTSEAGVAAFLQLGGKARGPAWCVGARTAQAATEAGFAVQHVAQDAEQLVAVINPLGPVVHFHGVHTRGDVVNRLASRGISAQGCAIYDQRPEPLSGEAKDALMSPGGICLPVFSPRTAQLFAQSCPDGMQSGLHVVALSKAVADAVSWPAKRICVAVEPTGDAMCDLVAKCLQGSNAA